MFKSRFRLVKPNYWPSHFVELRLENRNDILEVKKYINRMLVQGEYRDRLIEQLDEIESEVMEIY